MTSEPGSAQGNPERDVPIAGVGASAGGLPALRALFAHTPPDTGLCFVVVQHLHAEHDSQLAALLRSTTSMPVHEAHDDVPVRENEVFVITPNVELTVRDGRLRCAPRPAAGARHAPIDVFFRSLADDAGIDATAILLSGSGTDGTVGLGAVLSSGGATIVQSPSSSEVPDMPAHAIASGVAEVVLPPEAMGQELAHRTQHPASRARPSASSVPVDVVDSEPLDAVFAVLQETTGIDFSLYREKTVRRRLARRAAVRQIGSLAAYVDLLTREPTEQAALQQALLIGVTRFFRDPEAFDALRRHVFPALTAVRPRHAPIRIWVPGVASGEEGYSILMALHEYLHDQQIDVPVILFASDVNDEALRTARAARYPLTLAQELPAERLQRFFTRTEEGFTIVRALREACVFSRHNLLEDPPFSKLDLISCRNVLIYLDGAKRALFPLFHGALQDHGMLLLGRSEAPPDDTLFTPVEPRQSLYRRRPGHTTMRPVVRRDSPYRRLLGPLLPSPMALPPPGADPIAQAEDLLLARFSPSSVVVDANLEVLAVHGPAAPFFVLPSGRVSHHLVRLMADTNLFLEVQALVHDVALSGVSGSTRDIAYRHSAALARVDVDVTPVGSTDRRVYLVVFTLREQASTDETSLSGGAASPPPLLITQLTDELARIRQQLITLMEAQASSVEEHVQVTADALSDNEELKSLAEELETAKEELQSSNEELITLNRDLEARHQALTEAHDFGRAIIATVRAPLVVVGAGQIVRSVNAAFVRTFGIRPAEAEGHSLSDLASGAWDSAALHTLVAQVLDRGEPFEDVEFSSSMTSRGPRTLLISGRRLGVDMALLTMEDVSEARALQHAFEVHREQRRQTEKMESVGRLAGGIAHDFNNLLTVILGYCNLLRVALDGERALLAQVHEIQASAEHAAALTDQLLAFGRRKMLQPHAFDLNVLVRDFTAMMRQLLDVQILIVLECADALWPVRADSGEVRRILMNLALNARDAMSTGGTMTLATRNRVVTADEAAAHGAAAGEYVELTVADTGAGMDAETRAHLFEPFFTTKDISKGAGLGLSTVLGIVQQSEGFVWLDTAPGRGSRFGIALPRSPVAPAASPERGIAR